MCKYPDWTLHLVGKDFQDEYSNMLKYKVSNNDSLTTNVFFYGSIQDVAHIINQSTIGVLSSKSEGLPLSLLEYGFYSLPVIITDVGEYKDIVKNKETGLVVPSQNANLLASAIINLIQDDSLRETIKYNLKKVIANNYTEKTNIESLLKVYN